MKKAIFIFAAFAAFMSCAKVGLEPVEGPDNMDNTDTPEQVETKEVTIYAKAPEAKTQIDGTGNVTWSAGDGVKVCFPTHTNLWDGSMHYGKTFLFTAQCGDGDESALFKGDWTSASDLNSYGFIVYPQSVDFSYSYNAYTSTASQTFTYTIPEVQYAVDNTFAKELNLAYAPVTKAGMDANNPSVTFKNLCALIKIVLPQEEYNIKSITIESTNKNSDTGVLTGGLHGKATLSWNSAGVVSVASYPSQTPSITLEKSDDSNLTPGAAYYAVVWAGTHSALKLTFTDANGNKATKQTPSGSVIYCNAGQYTTLNIKSLSFDVAPTLSVGTSDVVINKKGSTSNVTVISNKDWTATSSASWLTATKYSGVVILSASANKEASERSATVTITAETLTRTIKVTQSPVTYSSTGGALTMATDLADDQMYVVARYNNRNQYWSVDSNQKLSMTTKGNTSEFTCPQVFVFRRDDSRIVDINYGSGKYTYRCAGAWQSAWNDKYLDHDFALASSVYYFTMQNAWGSTSSEDFDIYKAATDNEMVNVNTSFTGYWWGNGGTEYYKWSFYKVEEN